MRIYQSFISLLGLLIFAAGAVASTIEDPGVPDTVKIEGGPLVVGQSVPLTVAIFNDYEVAGYSLGLVSTSLAGGFARYDSTVYAGRLADPQLMDLRIEIPRNVDGIPPDTLLLGAQSGISSYGLIPGQGAILELYFTGLAAGTMAVDSGYVPPAGHFLLVTVAGHTYIPQYVSSPIQILEGHQPPAITVSEDPIRSTAGSEIEFSVQGTSPIGFPVTLSVDKMVGHDDPSRFPTNPPVLGPGNPGELTWNATADDIGIWDVGLKACDSSGTCAAKTVGIQVVEDGTYLLPFAVSEVPDMLDVTGLLHGNFDSDPNPEIFAAGGGERYSATLDIYDWSAGGDWSRVYCIDDGDPKFGPQLGYFNDDPFLDGVVMAFYDASVFRATVLQGNGDNTFTPVGTTNDGIISRATALGELTGDNHLDLAAVNYSVVIYAGDSQGHFIYNTTISPGERALSVNCADFNGDGHDDLAIGTVSGVKIYLYAGPGNFTEAFVYSQTYGSLDIEITNHGSDFNNDDIFDLCISTPSVGGTHSNMVAYFGNGDGSFDQKVIRTVKGQILGNRVGDLNNDGNLDIACVNGAQEYIAILYGDGQGAFMNETRYPIPHESPCQMDCFDADLDGDLDIVVVAFGGYGHNSLFFLENQLDPAGFAPQSVDISGRNNARLQLVSATGKTFNQVRNTMPSGEYYHRNMDQGTKLDDYMTLSVVENGPYTLAAMPKPDLAVGDAFSASFTINGQPYRFADNIPMREQGYQFTMFLGESSEISPRPGQFVRVNPPLFNWPGQGNFDLQVAADINFTDLVVETTVNGNQFTPEAPFEGDDTAIFYWRVKPHVSPEYNCLYVLNIITSGQVCADADGDGIIGVGDAVLVINYIFRAGPQPEPTSTGDANCDGIIDIGDAVRYVDNIFRGGEPPCCQ